MNESIPYNVEHLKRLYEHTSSGHWFDAGSMRFFNSRLTSHYRRMDDGHALFITTERGPDNVRRASIRHAWLVNEKREGDGRLCLRVRIETVGEFNSYASIGRAATAMKRITLGDLKS